MYKALLKSNFFLLFTSSNTFNKKDILVMITKIIKTLFYSKYICIAKSLSYLFSSITFDKK